MFSLRLQSSMLSFLSFELHYQIKNSASLGLQAFRPPMPAWACLAQMSDMLVKWHLLHFIAFSIARLTARNAYGTVLNFNPSPINKKETTAKHFKSLAIFHFICLFVCL